MLLYSLYIESKYNILALVGKANKVINNSAISIYHSHLCGNVTLKHALRKAMEF